MNKARQEIDFVIGKTRLVEESDIANLPYIQAIVKETLRLHPTAPLIPRESSRSCTINGYDIPERTRLLVMFGLLEGTPSVGRTRLSSSRRGFLARKAVERASWMCGGKISFCCHSGVEKECVPESRSHYMLSRQALSR